MQAPTENVEQLAQEHAQALNAAWWKGITKQGDEPEHLNFSVYENTAVVVGETKADINKSSYVQSGTSMLPAIIHNGDKVIYDIEISNTSTYESLSNIQVVDNLPNELSLIENELSYYFDGEGNVNNSIRISENDLITYVIDNNKITFNIKQLYSSQKIHLLIPVNIISSGQNNDVIMNQAAIISFNGIDYSKDSPITYHEAKYGNIKITKKLKYSQEDEDDDKSFRIKVELIPPSTIIDDGADTIDNVELAMNSTYSDVSFVNGIGYINLKNNESKTIEKLPEGYSFKISEDLDENFVPEVSLEEGTIVDNTTQEIEVVNVRIVNPSTGIEKTINQKTNNNLIILIISLIGDIIAIYFLIKQKKCNQ